MAKYRVTQAQDLAPLAMADAKCFGSEVELEAGATWWAAYPVLANGTLGPLAAYAGARLVDEGTALYLCRAGVLPWARGQGLQRRLIQTRVRWGKAQGATRAITYTMPSNPASANSLIRCGFRAYSPARAWTGPGACYWLKALA